jgi:probable phosphomutase (TIGR03848 family)
MHTTLLLIRHGETEYVRQGIMSARMPGVPLNEKGQAQAAAVAHSLVGAPITHIYSSPMQRAQETAAYLAQLCQMPVTLADGIIETDIGEWTGLKAEQVKDNEMWHILLNQPSKVQFPGGESFAGIQQRTVAELNAIAARHPGELTACFSHADVIRLALTYYLEMPLDACQRLSIDPCSVSIVQFLSNGRARVRRINQVVGPAWE